MSKLTRVLAMLTLALWGLASMHCKLESVSGLAVLRTCCFEETGSSAPVDCEDDGCGEVEDGNYRVEEDRASAPQPLLVLASRFASFEAVEPEPRFVPWLTGEVPPDLRQSWLFSRRAAPLPRAPAPAA